MALGLTQYLTERGIFLGVKGGRVARKAENLTAICEPPRPVTGTASP
jgi:hypothetical protein